MWRLAEDKDGNLWTGSTCGAKKIARYGFTIYTEEDGLDHENINSIFENSAGELFVSTHGEKRAISHFDGDKFSLVKPPLPKYVGWDGWGWQQTVWQDRKGAWWIPTVAGLFRTPPTSFANLARVSAQKQETGGKGSEIFRLFEDSRGDIWITTAGNVHELWHWERAKDTWRDHMRQAGFSAYRIGSAFVEDQSGNVWIGASSDHNNSTLVRYRNREFRIFTQAEGSPAGWIRDLFLDSRGRLWIASTGDGLWGLDDTNSDRFEFVKYTPTEGLTSIATACVIEDEFGRIYVGT